MKYLIKYTILLIINIFYFLWSFKTISWEGLNHDEDNKEINIPFPVGFIIFLAGLAIGFISGCNTN